MQHKRIDVRTCLCYHRVMAEKPTTKKHTKSELEKFQLHFEYDVETREVRRRIRQQAR